jgi:AraC family transcriptional regulator
VDLSSNGLLIRFSDVRIQPVYPEGIAETRRKLLSALKSNPDPLAVALARKAQRDEPGATEGMTVAAGEGWRVVDIVCTGGPRDRPYEERYGAHSISLVLSGAFDCRGEHGSSLMAPGTILLGNAGRAFECSHRYGEGDRCLSFQFESELFERLGYDAGASGAGFAGDCVPPLRALAPLTARARMALERRDSWEEIALELAGAVLRAEGDVRHGPPVEPLRHWVAIARILRELESHVEQPHTLAGLAHSAGLSRYHFLRTFRSVTGVTPHQWLLRARLRAAAYRLAGTREPVSSIALDVGFDDLSNFIRSFRAEFGVSPRQYRAIA